MSENIKNSFLKESIKGSLFATLFSVLFVLLFAVIMRIFGVGANSVEMVNLVIKILSVFFAVFIVAKNGGKILWKGIFVATGFLVLSNLLFLLLGGQIVLNDIAKDLFVCIIVGIVASIMAANRKKI